MKITVLGSGTSDGIPVVGCTCPVCTSDDPRDNRMRSSVYIEGSGGEKVLIDSGPEFRLQAVRAGIRGLDGIFLTHAHADHMHGLDDVRRLSRNEPIPVYGNKQTIAEMAERFSYVFGAVWGTAQKGGGKPKLSPQAADGPVRIGGLVITPVPVKHGVLNILGWEVGENASSPDKFLYLTDTSAIPPSSLEQLRSSSGNSRRSIIIGGLRIRPHETHFNFSQALDAALDLEAKEVYLTHICHEHSHAEIEKFCRHYIENRRTLVRQNSVQKYEGIEAHPAWDGLEIIL